MIHRGSADRADAAGIGGDTGTAPAATTLSLASTSALAPAAARAAPATWSLAAAATLAPATALAAAATLTPAGTAALTAATSFLHLHHGVLLSREKFPAATPGSPTVWQQPANQL